MRKDKHTMNGFTHFDHEGNAIMVDVHEKADTYRVAIAQGTITVNKEVFDAITHHTAKKGDVLGVARIAGIMAAKKNAELIPLCHIIALTDCEVQFSLDVTNHQITAICRTSCVGKTGVEMEAMTGVSVALLTIYDMCKAMDRSMVISGIQHGFHAVIRYQGLPLQNIVPFKLPMMLMYPNGCTRLKHNPGKGPARTISLLLCHEGVEGHIPHPLLQLMPGHGLHLVFSSNHDSCPPVIPYSYPYQEDLPFLHIGANNL